MTLSRFPRKSCIFLQASGTVHRLREREEELLKVSSLPQSCFCESHLIQCYYLILSNPRGIHAWGFRWPKGERGTHAVVGVANTEQVSLV